MSTVGKIEEMLARLESLRVDSLFKGVFFSDLTIAEVDAMYASMKLAERGRDESD